MEFRAALFAMFCICIGVIAAKLPVSNTEGFMLYLFIMAVNMFVVHTFCKYLKSHWKD